MHKFFVRDGLPVPLIGVVLEDDRRLSRAPLGRPTVRWEPTSHTTRAGLHFQPLGLSSAVLCDHVHTAFDCFDETLVLHRPQRVPGTLMQQRLVLLRILAGRCECPLLGCPRADGHRGVDHFLADHRAVRFEQDTQEMRAVRRDRRAVLIAHNV